MNGFKPDLICILDAEIIHCLMAGAAAVSRPIIRAFIAQAFFVRRAMAKHNRFWIVIAHSRYLHGAVLALGALAELWDYLSHYAALSCGSVHSTPLRDPYS